jgi:hypothetical protein
MMHGQKNIKSFLHDHSDSEGFHDKDPDFEVMRCAAFCVASNGKILKKQENCA